MKSNLTIAAAGLSLLVGALSVTPAQAHKYGHGWGHGHGWYPHKISCRKGRKIVRWSGFRRVRPIKCPGRFYVYRAKKWGHVYRVRVHSRRGFIAGVRPL